MIHIFRRHEDNKWATQSKYCCQSCCCVIVHAASQGIDGNQRKRSLQGVYQPWHTDKMSKSQNDLMQRLKL